MRAGLPEKEPQILKSWEEMDLYGRLRRSARGRDRFVLHDGPPTPTAISISATRSTRSSRTW